MIKRLINRIRQQYAYKKFAPLLYTPDLKSAYISGSVAGGSLRGKRVAITGATGGIGRAIAERFIKEGSFVLLIGRNINKLDHLQQEVGGETTCYVLDLNKTETFKEVIHRLMSEQPIDIWINNAGVSTEVDKRGDTLYSKEDFFRTFEVNYTATTMLTEQVANEMVSRHIKGSIINVTSMAAYHKGIFHTPYGIAKTALVSSTELLSRKYQNYLNIASIAPGETVSEMTGYGLGGNISKAQGGVNRLLLAEEIASTIAFLVSPLGEYIKGETVKIYPYTY